MAMIDPITGAMVGSVGSEFSKAGGGVLSRLLGPVADEIGQQLLEKYRHRNVQRVVVLAAECVGNNESAGISPRVAAAIFEAASFAENEFVAGYLSGVLASSTSNRTGDQGVGWSALVGRLSSDQLHLHFLFYGMVRSLLLGQDLTENEICKTRFFVPFSSILRLMDWESEETPGFIDAFYGLLREDVVSRVHFAYGNVESLTQYQGADVVWPSAGLTFAPARAGLLLYLWGFGHGGLPPFRVISTELDFTLAGVVSTPEIVGASKVDELPRRLPD
jgi:hypothetical protein